MAASDRDGSLGGFVRRRWPWWVALSAAVTLLAMQYSFAHGRLSRDVTFDDIVYFIEGAQRLDAAYAQGVAGLVRGYWNDPPHSPFSALLASASFAVFGLCDWAPYAGNALLVLAAVAATDWLLRGIPRAAWACGLFLLLSSLLVFRTVEEFRPDLACGLFTALGVAAALRGGFCAGGLKRAALIGLLFGLALLAKPTAFPLTLVMEGAALLLAGACDAGARAPGAAVGRWLLRAGVCVLASLLMALPHYAVAWPHVITYIRAVLTTEDLRLSSGRTFSPWYYVTGEAGASMLGPHLYLCAAAWLAGLATLACRRLLAPFLRLLALGPAALLAVAAPTRTAIFNPFFAATFDWLVLLGGLEGLRSLFIGAAPSPARRPVVAWVVVLILAAAVPAASIFTAADDLSRDRARDREITDAASAVFDFIRRHSEPAKPPVVFDASGGGATVDGAKLCWRACKEGFVLRLLNPPAGEDLEPYRQYMEAADFVLACAPLGPVAPAWLNTYACGRLAPRTLAMAQENPDFHEVGRYPVRGEVVFHLFQRRPMFGGWGAAQGLNGLEGPYPQWGLPRVRWGDGPETRLQFESRSQETPRLHLSCLAMINGQSITVRVDGERAARHDLPPAMTFSDLDIPLRVTAGQHVIELQYAVHDEAAAHAVLFRRLEISADSPASPAQAVGTPSGE